MSRMSCLVAAMVQAFCVVLACPALAADLGIVAASDGSPLRIVFVANSRGLTEPCPVCGTRALGGLARRASVVRGLRADGVPTLYVAGPYELKGTAALDAEHPARRADAPVPMWRRAQEILPPQVGCATSEEAALCVPSLPGGYVAMGGTPEVRRIDVAGRSVAVVLFPELPDGRAPAALATVPKPLVDAVIGAALGVSDADLVVGVSPWGFSAEGRVLPRLDGFYDLLLGAGPGSYFSGEVPVLAPGVVWVRSEADGRSVMEVVFADAGRHARPKAWVKDVDFRAGEIFLGNDVEDDRAMRRVLGPAGSHQ